jgi:N-acetylmuramoyl-L-alanine amidase
MMKVNDRMMHGLLAAKRGIAVLLVLLATFSVNAQMGIKTVVIDPGHGGSDPGAVGPTKKYEKDVVLSISLKLGEQIRKAYPDVKVVYTRETDKFLGLADRADMANKLKADLFISIHANASTNSTAYGSETWVLGLHKNDAWLEVAKRENAVITLEEDYSTKYDQFDPNDPESYIWLSMRQNAYLNQSIGLAADIQKHFTSVKRFDRGVKQAGFLVLYRTTMPAILVEVGFISNPTEEKYLASTDGQDEIANSLFKAFSNYKKEVDGVNSAVNGDTENKTDGGKTETAGNEKVEQPQPIKPDSNLGNGRPVFSVQVMASPKQVVVDTKNFKGHTDVIEYISGGLYKYAIGRSDTFTQAVEMQKKLRDEGFESAFVVAFLNGERIDVNKAKELAKQ